MLNEAHRLLDEAGAEHLKEIATRLARPAVALRPLEADDRDLPIGTSKFGGAPDLPVGQTAWPRGEDEAFLTFLAQINLMEVAPFLEGDPIWPQDGLLLFFANMDEEMDGRLPQHMNDFRVRFVPDGTELGRVSPPTPKASKHGPGTPAPRLKPCRLNMGRVMTMPVSIFHPAVPELGLSDANRDQLSEAIMNARDCPAGEEAYRFGGYPIPEQDSPEVGWSLRIHGINDGPHLSQLPGAKEIMRKGRDWRLLLEIEVNEPFGVPYGPVGTLYFGATEEAIRTGSYEWIWMERQFD